MRIVGLDTLNEFRSLDTLRHLRNCVRSFTSQVSDRSRHLCTPAALSSLRHPDASSSSPSNLTKTPQTQPLTHCHSRTRSTTTSLTGGDRPCSSQPSFRSRSCHWPQVGILQDLFQPQVVQRTHITPSPTPLSHPDPEPPPPASFTAQVHSPPSQQ